MGLLKLEELAKETKQEVIQEATHHGPYLETPSMFIEIGSEEKQWKDKKLGKLLAKAVYHLITTEPEKCRAAFGIGGQHHTPNFKKVMLKTDIAFGHVCPKYNLENLTKEMILQAIERTKEKVDLIVLDWKGLGQEKERIVKLLEELKLNYKKSKELIS